MGGRKRRKAKLLAATATTVEAIRVTNCNENEKMVKQTWSHLPTELLELILCHLALIDNIRASVVCKGWHTAAISVRVVNQPPWLMYFPRFGNLYEFYDPGQRKTCSREFPQLFGSRVCYTKDGWLLLYKPSTHRVFFFNPFTQQVIKLPRFELPYQIVAFSCAPTSASCVVFTVKHISPMIVAISTCHPGATGWMSINHQNRLPFVTGIWNKIVFCDGLFYCLGLSDRLGVYDPLERTWNVLAVPPPKCPDDFFAKNWWKRKYMAEYNREVVVIYACCNENPIIFKLERSKMIWEEIRILDGATLFVSFLSSHYGTCLQGIMGNSIYFSKVRFFGKRCISYSLDDSRYYPSKQCYDWGDQDAFENIWIEPPRDMSTFI